jgi:Arc/MetJ-type ribon-helix-helix transcriptional regulator
MEMVRTQVYLTNGERDGLESLAEASGKKQSELIREAIDRLLERTGKSRSAAILDRAAGLWKDRTDLPDFHATRAQWDRA